MSRSAGAGVLAALRQAAATAAKSAPANPDAEFIRVCFGHREKIAAFNREPDDDGPAEKAYNQSREFIDEYEPVTMEGLIAFAHAARAEAERLDGTFEPNGTPAGSWCWEIAMTLIEIGDSGAETPQFR